MNKKTLSLIAILAISIPVAFALPVFNNTTFDEYCAITTAYGAITAGDFICKLDIFQMKDDITDLQDKTSELDDIVNVYRIHKYMTIFEDDRDRGYSIQHFCHTGDLPIFVGYNDSYHTRMDVTSISLIGPTMISVYVEKNTPQFLLNTHVVCLDMDFNNTGFQKIFLN